MERNVRSDWAVCPHCHSFAMHAFLLPADPSTAVRWSTCADCQQTAIWAGTVAVFPAGSRALATPPKSCTVGPSAGAGDARTPDRISPQ
ncbi:MAG: hypothetical protein WEB13_12825 [Dehalococcoidia bacterium]